MGGQPYWTQDTGGFFVSHQGGERATRPTASCSRAGTSSASSTLSTASTAPTSSASPITSRTPDPTFSTTRCVAPPSCAQCLLPYHYGLAWRTHADGWHPHARPRDGLPRGRAPASTRPSAYGPAFLVRPVALRQVRRAALRPHHPATALGARPMGNPASRSPTTRAPTSRSKPARPSPPRWTTTGPSRRSAASRPASGINNFSARWVGQLIAPESGEIRDRPRG